MPVSHSGIAADCYIRGKPLSTPYKNLRPSGLPGSNPGAGVFSFSKTYKKAFFLKHNMEKDIGKIKKNDTTDIVVRIDDFGGRAGVTIREFMTGDRYTGFTKSGTRIPVESFAEFKEMINSVTEEDLKAAKEAAEESQEKTTGQKQAESGEEKTEEGQEIL